MSAARTGLPSITSARGTMPRAAKRETAGTSRDEPGNARRGSSFTRASAAANWTRRSDAVSASTRGLDRAPRAVTALRSVTSARAWIAATARSFRPSAIAVRRTRPRTSGPLALAVSLAPAGSYSRVRATFVACAATSDGSSFNAWPTARRPSVAPASRSLNDRGAGAFAASSQFHRTTGSPGNRTACDW